MAKTMNERLIERAVFEDKRVLEEAKAAGFVPEVYSGSQTGALLREAAAEIDRLSDLARRVEGDAARLDWLERTARDGGIFLYNGVDVKRERQTAVGLGLRPGRMDRNLRQAIDQARGVPLDAADGAEGVSHG
jgi:hypothetical protein